MRKNPKRNIAVTVYIAAVIMALACYGISALKTAVTYEPYENSMGLESMLLVSAIPYAILILLVTAIAIVYLAKSRNGK